MIQFSPASVKEGLTAGAAITDGKYSIERDKGLVPGSYRVVINSVKGGEAPLAAGEAPGPVSASSEPPKDLIPAEYNETAKPVEVKAGVANTLDFAVKTK